MTGLDGATLYDIQATPCLICIAVPYDENKCYLSCPSF